MRRRGLFLALLSALLARLPLNAVETTGLSDDARGRIARLEQDLAQEEQGRRLLAEASAVARRGAEGLAAAVVFERTPTALLFDLGRLADARQPSFELTEARALSLAAQGLSLELPESDEKAWSDELVFALEKAARDKPFASSFRAALRGEERDLLDTPPPEDELRAAAYYAARLKVSVDSFCRAVERGRQWDEDAISLTALSDFIDRYGPGYQDVTLEPGSPYARAGEKRYPAALYRAALALKAAGGLAPVREALGPLETETLPELRRRLERFK